MKKVLSWVLLLTLILGMFAGCKQEQVPETTAPTDAVSQGDLEGITAALEYLKVMYKTTEEATPTPRDYERLGIVHIGGVPYEVVWTTDLSEDMIQVVVNDDNTVTIKILQQPEEDMPYQLTATISDSEGNSVSHSWSMILPKAVDMAAIVDAAYELANGESLPFEATLTGKIISIDTVWSEDYQNITVTMVVEGKEDKPIKCYRLKGEGAKDLMVGNIITVTGTIKNYNGTIEFDAGCILEAVEKGDAVEAPTDPGEILKAAYALGEDQALPYPAVLTGKVIKIDSPYDPNYGNISVVIEVEGYSQYPILCYRLKGLGVDQIALEDIITVNGIIKNYKGTIEYDAGCQMIERISGGNVAEKPSSDPNKIIPDALALAPGESLPYRATLTGTIYSIDTPYSSQYNNITVTMVVNGYKFQCYRMVGDGIDLIRETDKITVSGIIKNYNGKIEFDAKCTLDAWEKGPRNVNYGPVKEDVAYALYIDQKTAGKTIYFNGAISGVRLQTSDKGSKAIEVYGERVSGKGMRFFYMEGNTKKYIEIEEYLNDEGKARGRAVVTTSPSCVWTYLSDMGVYVVTLPTAGKYFLGTYSSYETITASWSGYLESSSNPQYVAEFMKHSDVPIEEPATMIPEGTPVDAPVVGTAYKFGFYQNQVEGKPFLAFSGKMAGYYMATVNVMAEMTDVYLEEANGGYYLYFKSGNTKTYIDMIVRESDNTKVDIKLQSSGTHTVWKLNLEHKYVYSSLAGSEWYLGTFNTNTSISASKTSFISNTSVIGVSQFCAWFNNVVEVPAPEEEEPEEPDVPAADATLITQPVYGTAYKLGMNVNGKILYLTGKTTDVNYRLATTTDAAQAADFYLEAVPGVNGGAYLYFMNGNTKTYVRVYHRQDGDPGYGKGSLELVTAAPSEYFGWSAEANTLIYDYDGNNAYYMGTFDYQGSIYENASVSNTYYITGNKASTIDVSQFPVHFYTVELSETPDVSEPTTTVPTPSEPAGDLGVVEAPEAGTAYKFGMVQGNVGTDVYYITGVKDGYYMATTTDTAAAADVYLEATNGGYYLYTNVNGAKKYINMVVNGTHVNGEFENTASTVYTYDSEKQTVVATVNDALYWFGTRNDKTFTTIGPVKVEYEGFYAKFYAATGSVEPDVTEPTTTEPVATEPPASEPAGDLGVVGAPVAGTAYKFGMVQGNVGTDVYYITGVKEGYYMATTTDTAAAADVYLEATNGGYYLYTNVNGAKKYINMVVNGTHVNGEFENTASTVYTYDSEKQTVVATVNDALYWFGTRNDKTFTTIGPVKVEYEGFYAKFYAATGSVEPDVTEPTTTEPVATEPPASEPAGEGYHKITSAEEFTSGQYVMIVSTGYAPGVYQSGWLSAVQPVVSGNTVTDPAGGVWTLTVNGNSVILTDANGIAIAPKGGNSNGVSEGSYEWAWTFENGTFRFAGTGSDTVYLASNATTTGQYPGNHRFRGYKTTTCSNATNYPSLFTLYKLDEGGGSTEPEVTEPITTEPVATEPTPSEPATDGNYVTSIETGVTYKWGINQENNGTMLYFAGTMNGFYGAATQNFADGVDVILEAADGGYYITFTDAAGAKKYITVVTSGTYKNFTIADAPANVYTWNDEYATLNTDVNGTTCYIGTYGTYKTFSISSMDKISTSFPSHFYTTEPSGEPEATEPAPSEPAGDLGVVGAPVAGTAYKFGMVQGNVGTDVYYITGVKEGYYMATTTDTAAAADVYLEATNGGYYLYTNVNGAKKYINMVVNGTHVNGEFENTASTVYTYDSEKQTVVATVNDALYWFGTRNDKTFTTIGPVKVEYEGFYAKFYSVSGSTEPEVTEPEATEPEATEPPATETPAGPESVTYTFSNYDKGTQYAVGENHQLDDKVTLTINYCHLNTTLRIYQDANYNGNVVFTSTKVITGMTINAGYRASGLEVYGSADGETWTLVETLDVGANNADFSVEMPAGSAYKYVKLDAVDAQIRIPYITFDFA